MVITAQTIEFLKDKNGIKTEENIDDDDDDRTTCFLLTF